MMDIKKLLSKSRDNTISLVEIDTIANMLREKRDEVDAYTVIHILGHAGAVQYEPLIAQYLEAKEDPMLAKIALQVLCSFWNKTRTYLEYVRRFLRGVEWDTAHDVQLIALSIAGEYVRDHDDGSLLRDMLGIMEDASQEEEMRDAAYCALARASGKVWNELPSATQVLDWQKDVDSDVINWVNTILGKQT